MPSILTISDLPATAVESILDRAEEFRARGRWQASPAPRLVGLLFLEPSLRTRVGFAAAATRLGWQFVEVVERRQSPVSRIESWEDTLRIVSGYVDVIVTRPGRALTSRDLLHAGRCPVVNGGDAGPLAEHPSQALIDLFAMRRFAGRVSDISLAIVGDPRMRAVRSLLGLLARTPPRSLVFLADAEHRAAVDVPSELRAMARDVTWDELAGADVVYVAGVPDGSVPLDRRNGLRLTGERLATLPEACILLSPLPVIDEMDDTVRRDPRDRAFEQSDLGLYVRMALLEYAVAERTE